jgi:hypothetical protein
VYAPLAISFPPDEQIWYVTVMGQGGMEYGLILQRTWEQVEGLFHELDDPIRSMPSEGWHAVSFKPAYQLAFADLDAIETYNWQVAGEEAHPLPAIYDLEAAHRPPASEYQDRRRSPVGSRPGSSLFAYGSQPNAHCSPRPSQSGVEDRRPSLF